MTQDIKVDKKKVEELLKNGFPSLKQNEPIPEVKEFVKVYHKALTQCVENLTKMHTEEQLSTKEFFSLLVSLNKPI
jgi:hypothetical protein